MNQNIINIHSNLLKTKICPFCNEQLKQRNFMFPLECFGHIAVTDFIDINNNYIYLHHLKVYIGVDDIAYTNFTGTDFKDLIKYINKIQIFQ